MSSSSEFDNVEYKAWKSLKAAQVQLRKSISFRQVIIQKNLRTARHIPNPDCVPTPHHKPHKTRFFNKVKLLYLDSLLLIKIQKMIELSEKDPSKCARVVALLKSTGDVRPKFFSSYVMHRSWLPVAKRQPNPDLLRVLIANHCVSCLRPERLDPHTEPCRFSPNPQLDALKVFINGLIQEFATSTQAPVNPALRDAVFMGICDGVLRAPNAKNASQLYASLSTKLGERYTVESPVVEYFLCAGRALLDRPQHHFINAQKERYAASKQYDRSAIANAMLYAVRLSERKMIGTLLLVLGAEHPPLDATQLYSMSLQKLSPEERYTAVHLALRNLRRNVDGAIRTDSGSMNSRLDEAYPLLRYAQKIVVLAGLSPEMPFATKEISYSPPAEPYADPIKTWGLMGETRRNGAHITYCFTHPYEDFDPSREDITRSVMVTPAAHPPSASFLQLARIGSKIPEAMADAIDLLYAQRQGVPARAPFRKVVPPFLSDQ